MEQFIYPAFGCPLYMLPAKHREAFLEISYIWGLDPNLLIDSFCLHFAIYGLRHVYSHIAFPVLPVGGGDKDFIAVDAADTFRLVFEHTSAVTVFDVLRPLADRTRFLLHLSHTSTFSRSFAHDKYLPFMGCYSFSWSILCVPPPPQLFVDQIESICGLDQDFAFSPFGVDDSHTVGHEMYARAHGSVVECKSLASLAPAISPRVTRTRGRRSFSPIKDGVNLNPCIFELNCAFEFQFVPLNYHQYRRCRGAMSFAVGTYLRFMRKHKISFRWRQFMEVINFDGSVIDLLAHQFFPADLAAEIFHPYTLDKTLESTKHVDWDAFDNDYYPFALDADEEDQLYHYGLGHEYYIEDEHMN
jgi:hypothetical protein